MYAFTVLGRWMLRDRVVQVGRTVPGVTSWACVVCWTVSVQEGIFEGSLAVCDNWPPVGTKQKAT